MAYKHDYDKILTRLVNILSKLNDGEALSVKELAEEFGVSTKTIQRDFNERLKKQWGQVITNNLSLGGA
jgi:predicted DNA-binding transcriptional regulator YafY